MKKIIDGLTTDGKIMYGTAVVLLLATGLNVLFPGILPEMPNESMPVLAGIFGISFGKSKSENVNSSASAGYDLQESMNQSGSQQGSDAASLGLNISQSGQSIYGGQAPYVNDLYAQAQNLYQSGSMPDRQVADLNSYLQAGLDNQYGFATGAGQDIYTKQLQSSLQNLGGYGNAANTANVMSGGNVYNAPINRGIDMGTAMQASYNPYLEGQIDAASRDVTRNLYENQMTGNAAMAAGTGNSASSRRAVMDAIAMRGAADRIGDIGATLRGNAYNTGLGIAAQQGLANQSAMSANNALNAGLMGQGAQLNYNIGQMGQQGIQQAYNTGANNTQMQLASGDYLRQYQQQLLDTAFQNQMNPYNSLQFYKGIIGDPTILSSANSIGLDQSQSNSFGNSFSNSYNYGMGGNTAAGSGTGSASSWNFGAQYKPMGSN